jgi:hypothetical protein
MERQKRIAKVTSAHLGWEDHGIFTCWVDLDYGGSAQGAGFYSLDRWHEGRKQRIGTAKGLEFIMRLMQVFAARDWSDIVGKTCYAIIADSKVVGLEPLPTERGKAFRFDTFWEEETS